MAEKPTRAETVEAAKDSIEVLERELERASNLLLPLLREYLKDVRSIRMGFAEEVIHIINSSRNLNEIVKQTPNLIEYVAVIKQLQETLTPEFIDMISKLKKE